MSLAADFERAEIELIKTLGADVTFRRPDVGGSYSATTGTVTGGTDGDETALVAFGRFADVEVDGTSIQRGDRKAYISTERQGTALTKTPKPGDLLVGKRQTVRIISVRTIEIGDTVAAYVAQVRE